MQRCLPVSDGFEDYGRPDQSGDHARRVPTDFIHRQGCRSACSVAATGPSHSDGEQTVAQPGDQACRIPADTVHRQGYCRFECGNSVTGPSYSDFVEVCRSPAGAVRRDCCECACDLADQPGDQVGRDSADSVHRQGCRHTCGDGTTGPSVSDCAETSAFRRVCTNISLTCQCLKKSKRTSSRGVEIQPPVAVQRQVPQLQTVVKTGFFPSIKQVTKHAYFPRTQYIDKIVDMPAVMQ